MGPLVQLHWQKIDDYDETQFVAQCDLEQYAELQKIPHHESPMWHWMEELKSEGHEPPDGWQQLIVDSTHPHFVWAKPEPGK